MSARDEILTKVRNAIEPRAGATDQSMIPRDYRTSTNEDLDTFLDRLGHTEAVTHVVDQTELDQTVRTALEGRKIVVPDGIPENWTADLEALTDQPQLTPQELDGADGVLTTCAVAIAQTGTIVLDGGPGMGRRALTLVPDYHLCVVQQSQIVGSIPEALNRLDPSRPLTFISGPSGTVDIEMVPVRGVHGPRRLEVIISTSANLTKPPGDAAT